jgi:hypothetical protein
MNGTPFPLGAATAKAAERPRVPYAKATMVLELVMASPFFISLPFHKYRYCSAKSRKILRERKVAGRALKIPLRRDPLLLG